jgi:hypothetical protein
MHRTCLVAAAVVVAILGAFAGCNRQSAMRQEPSRQARRVSADRESTAGLMPAAIAETSQPRFRFRTDTGDSMDMLALESRRYESAARRADSRTFEERLLHRSLRRARGPGEAETTSREAPHAEVTLAVAQRTDDAPPAVPFRSTDARLDGMTAPPPPPVSSAPVSVEIGPVEIGTAQAERIPAAPAVSGVPDLGGPELNEPIRRGAVVQERLSRPVAQVYVTAQVTPEPDEVAPELGMIRRDWIEPVELKPVGRSLFSALESL